MMRAGLGAPSCAWRSPTAVSLLSALLVAAACLAHADTARARDASDPSEASAPADPSATVAQPAGPGADTASRPAEPLLTPARLSYLKGITAALGAAVLLWGAQLRRRGAGGRARRAGDAGLLVLGLFAGFCWWNLGQIPGHYSHIHDFFHYFVGAKYFRELGYTHLYRCSALADLQIGRGDPLPMVRNLSSYRPESTRAIFAHPGHCERRFSPERWQAFRHDVAWFERQMPQRRWLGLHWDHGYNATPAWGILGTLLTQRGPPSPRRIEGLAYIDPVLLVAMWWAVWWAFGWRATCAALIYWGTNYPADFGWTGGGFLRQDWLFAAVVGVCLLRRGWTAWAGVLLTLSALLRIFPALLIAALALNALLGMLRARRLRPSPAHWRFAAGSLATLAVVLPLSVHLAGAGAWGDFVENSRVHAGRIYLASVGFDSVMSFDPATRFETLPRVDAEGRDVDRDTLWADARNETLEERWVARALLLAGYGALLVWALRGREDWVAAVLGVGLIPMTSALSNYYYGILLLMALLACRDLRYGAALCALAALTRSVPLFWHLFDEMYAAVSALVCAAVVLVTWQVAREPLPPAEPERSEAEAEAVQPGAAST